jgi:hypothetical protein
MTELGGSVTKYQPFPFTAKRMVGWRRSKDGGFKALETSGHEVPQMPKCFPPEFAPRLATKLGSQLPFGCRRQSGKRANALTLVLLRRGSDPPPRHCALL